MNTKLNLMLKQEMHTNNILNKMPIKAWQVLELKSNFQGIQHITQTRQLSLSIKYITPLMPSKDEQTLLTDEIYLVPELAI